MALTFDEWMAFGITKGWCGPPVCYTHDGLPMAEQEDMEFAEGQDPCLHIVRLYEDNEMKNKIEDNHSPSNWRNSYTQVSGSTIESEK
jgi:hypothetical protein